MNLTPLLLATLLVSPLALAQAPAPAGASTDVKRHSWHQHHTQRPLMGADANKDGAVSREEAQALFNKRFDALDQNKDGRITSEEMRAARSTRSKERAEHARARFEERFKKADSNHDGMLSRAEADAGMPRLGRHFDRLDGNKDGQVNMEELRNAVHHRRGPAERRPGPRS